MKRILLAAMVAAALPVAANASVYRPVYGNPNSVQHQILQAGMDIQDFEVEGADRFDVEGDADTVGGAVTHWEAMAIEGERYEARYQKAWRPFEGQRARALVDVPVNVLAFNGDNATSVSLSLGLEVPVTTNWSLTPRVVASKTWSPTSMGGDGDLYGASVTSRFRLAQVGRGDLVIGNMIAYTKASDAFSEGENWAFRNGIAYQFPIKTLVFGRQASARVSYTHTQLEGDPVTYEQTHEVAANFGVRLREVEAKNKFEVLRIGILYTWIDDYDATTLTVGYRF
jgi:hypothetical protein